MILKMSHVLIHIHDQVVGGAVGLVFELPEAIDNWKEMIENNHVTEASKSLTDTADAILKTCKTLRKQFSDIKYEVFCDSPP